jgi:hypothetical protein
MATTIFGQVADAFEFRGVVRDERQVERASVGCIQQVVGGDERAALLQVRAALEFHRCWSNSGSAIMPERSTTAFRDAPEAAQPHPLQRRRRRRPPHPSDSYHWLIL